MAARAAESRLLCQDVRSLTLRLSLPCLVSMLASGLSMLLDAIFLSRASSSLAAAAGLCFPLVTLIQTIGFTLGMGSGSFVSRELGSGGESQRARAAASTALYAALALGGALCLMGQLFPAGLLRLLGAQEEMLVSAVFYARFVLACAPLTCTSLVLASLLRAQGYPAPGVWAYCAGLLTGAGLCYFLMMRLSLGVIGAGIAMLVREALILAVFSIYTLRLKGALRPVPRAVSLRLCTVRDIMRSGLPTLVRQGLMSVSGAMLSHALAQLGESAVAGMGLALRMVNLVSSAIIGFGQGFAPVCGANYGAGRMDRVQEAYSFCLRVLMISLALLGAAVYIASPFLLSRLAPDEASAAFGLAALRAQSAVFFAQGAVILMNMLTQSMGLPVRATLIASSRQGYIFIPLLLVLPRLFGAWGIICAQPASDLLSLLLSWALVRGFTGSSSSRCGCSCARKGFR